MRIVSWNIRAGGGVRREGIRQQLLDWKPDIIALSEFRATDASQWIANQLKTNGFPHQRTTTDLDAPSVNSLLIASRKPLRQIRTKNQPSNERRWLHVNVAHDTPIALMAMHIPNRSSGLKYPFLDSVVEVIKHWRGPPAVIIGDTNSGCIGIDEESPAFNTIEDKWIKTINQLNWRDTFRLCHHDRREYTWYSPNGRNGFRLDQAFLHPTLQNKVTLFEHRWGGMPNTKREILSDHAAIVLDLDL